MSDDNRDPWKEAGERWSRLGGKLADRYRDLAGPDGPSEEDLRDALLTIGNAVQTVVSGVGAAMKDPTVRHQVREATASLIDALGQTFSELGHELREEEKSSEL